MFELWLPFVCLGCLATCGFAAGFFAFLVAIANGVRAASQPVDRFVCMCLQYVVATA